ncbi:MAG: acetamidase [SAR202 cluster bacterium]|nr:acetamidase [SAR202 cluster bacterium]
MKRANTDVLYFETGPDNAPTMWVDPGEEFEIQTQLNRGPWLDGHPQEAELRKKLRSGNPSSGAIYVNGAQPGQRLIVHIGQIDVDPVGFTKFHGHNDAFFGWLGNEQIGAHEKVVQIKDGFIHWSDTLKLPLAPMLGVVGTAPERTRWTNGWAGKWGGNFDIQEVTTGASVHLPVYVPGALLHVGDMHARQGDGEICSAGGIEAGGRVRMRVELAPLPKVMGWPRITNETHIMTTAQARPAEDAFRIALAEMILWLEDEYGIPRGEAYMLLGQVLEARVTQFVNPTYSYVLKVNRKWLPKGRL